MASVNVCIFLGNLTRDPELKFTPKGTAVANLGIAVNEVWVDDQGNKHESATFLDCEAWGRTAEIAEEYLTKGDQVHLQCHAKLETWDDKESGKKRSKMKFVVDKLTMLGTKKKEDAPERKAPPSRSAPPARRPSPHDPDLDTAVEDDIPF